MGLFGPKYRRCPLCKHPSPEVDARMDICCEACNYKVFYIEWTPGLEVPEQARREIDIVKKLREDFKQFLEADVLTLKGDEEKFRAVLCEGHTRYTERLLEAIETSRRSHA